MIYYDEEEEDEFDHCPKCGGIQPDGWTCVDCGFINRACPYEDCEGPMEYDNSVCPYCERDEDEFVGERPIHLLEQSEGNDDQSTAD